MQKPDWWPRNPYPKSIFTMPEERYPEIVPDPELRTSLSGMLGRQFWDIASDAIWEAMLEASDDLLQQIHTALRHASGRYHEDEPKLSEGQVRKECYEARLALEEAMEGEV